MGKTMGLAVIVLLCLPVAGHTETALSEYSLKSAFIFNFAKFVEWPDNAFKKKGEFCIATLGRSPLDKELAGLAGKSVHGLSIVVRQLNSTAEAAQCQILFISRSELTRLEPILDTLGDSPVLTIGESDDFCRNGGMLALVKIGGKIGFDLNIAATQRARLKPNPQLMKLSRKIYGRQ